MTRHALSIFVVVGLATLGVTGCAHRGIKPAPAPAPASQVATAATMTAPISATSSTAASTSAAAPATTSAAAMAESATTASAPAATATSAAAASTASTPSSATTIPNMPSRGMSMANVEHIFGAPLEKLPAVPDPGTKLHPPITRWIYPDYVVYFEYNYVVHSVLKAHPFSSGD